MATVILVRHGRTTANATGILAGRTPGVKLDDAGRDQADRTAERLAVVPLVGVVSSPLERCRQTARYIIDEQGRDEQGRDEQSRDAQGRDAQGRDEQGRDELSRESRSLVTPIEKGITECDYGEWQGRALADLVKEDLWSVVQTQPSAAVFPGGESLAAMQARSVAAIRRHDAFFESQHGPGAVWVAVSHGDIIKSILADALGMHLDLFQRINVGPASVSIVRYGPNRPSVLTTNTDSGDLSWLRTSAPSGDAAVGGGAGNHGLGKL